MKSKTSCYDPATSRMTLRRFAPVWILYTIGLFLISAGIVPAGRYGEDGAISYMQQSLKMMSMYNIVYAFALGQLLFGDLYNTRLFYAIRALPITRGGWFGTQIILGILGSVLPNLLNAGVLYLMTEQFRKVAMWWAIVAQMQFFLFFGLAVLCAICAGNRFGMGILYAMIGFLDLASNWFRQMLYLPLLFGLRGETMRTFLSPMLYLTNARYFEPFFSEVEDVREDGLIRYLYEITDVQTTAAFWSVFVYAAVGIAAIALAMYLFRRRKPECAGDLLAFRGLRLAFLILFTLDAGAAAHIVAYLVRWELGYLMLAVGLILGYFACQMLLKRKINVVSGRTVLHLSAFLGIFLLTVVLTGLDVFGITNRFPDVSEIEYLTVDSLYGAGLGYRTEDPEMIGQLLEIQRNAVAEHREYEQKRPIFQRIFGDEQMEMEFYDSDGEAERSGTLSFVYQLKNGKRMTRNYFYHTSSQDMPRLRQLFSSPTVVFSEIAFVDQMNGVTYPESITVDQLAEATNLITLRCPHQGFAGESENIFFTEESQIREIIEAMMKDCEAGTLYQAWFMRGGEMAGDSIVLRYPFSRAIGYCESEITIFPSCENTYRWLIENGIHEELP